MWRIRQTPLENAVSRWQLLDEFGRELTFGQVVHGWRRDEAFCEFWRESLSGIPYGSYCWECPAVRADTLERAFECVFISSPSLAQMGREPEAFAEHFQPGVDVATFGNLGGDALLVAPRPEGRADFSHLASFTRSASASLQQALWTAVGQALESRIGERRLWLNTAGHGVAWLHVRLDDAPKYYRYAAYANA